MTPPCQRKVRQGLCPLNRSRTLVPCLYMKDTGHLSAERGVLSTSVALLLSESGMQDQACNDNLVRVPPPHTADRALRGHESLHYKTGLAMSHAIAEAPLAALGHAVERESPPNPDFRAALIRGLRLALVTVSLGLALALLDHWGGPGTGLGAAVLIALWQWRLSKDPYYGAFCLLICCAVAIAMLSSSAILWGDLRFGLAGIGFIMMCCLALFVGQAAVEIDLGDRISRPSLPRSLNGLR